MRSAEFLRWLWAASVSWYATYGVFPWDSHKKLAWVLDSLYVTDSLPENVTRAEWVDNMEIISLKTDFEKLIYAQ